MCWGKDRVMPQHLALRILMAHRRCVDRAGEGNNKRVRRAKRVKSTVGIWHLCLVSFVPVYISPCLIHLHTDDAGIIILFTFAFPSIRGYYAIVIWQISYLFFFPPQTSNSETTQTYWVGCQCRGWIFIPYLLLCILRTYLYYIWLYFRIQMCCSPHISFPCSHSSPSLQSV